MSFKDADYFHHYKYKNMNSSDDIIINPLTQKPIKIGGRVYTRLVSDGVISAHNDLLKNELDTYDSDEEADSLIQNYNEILKEDKKNLHAVRGRGKHLNKIVVRRKISSPAVPTKKPIFIEYPATKNNIKPGKDDKIQYRKLNYKPKTEYYIQEDEDELISEIEESEESW